MFHHARTFILLTLETCFRFISGENGRRQLHGMATVLSFTGTVAIFTIRGLRSDERTDSYRQRNRHRLPHYLSHLTQPQHFSLVPSHLVHAFIIRWMSVPPDAPPKRSHTVPSHYICSLRYYSLDRTRLRYPLGHHLNAIFPNGFTRGCKTNLTGTRFCDISLSSELVLSGRPHS